MRRIKAAIWILSLVFALSVCSHIAVRHVTTKIYTSLYSIGTVAATGDIAGAQQQLQDLLNYYESHQHVLELFLRRESVASLSVNIHGLTAYLAPDNLPDLRSEIDKAAEQTQMLEHLFLSIV